MNPGKHIVKITNCGMTGEGDKIQPFAEFQNAEGETIQWRGYLTEKAKEYAIKNAVTLGFSGKDWSEFNIAKVDASREYEILVVEEVYEGKTRNKVRFINLPKRMQLANASEVRAKLGSSKADFDLYRAKNGVKLANSPSDDVLF